MAPNKHIRPLSNEGKLSPSSASNTISARSDRPTRLENALKAFRDVLTDDEREMLRTEMDVPRDASQVIAFTAGLDLVDPTRRGKSIATRLHSILQTVQQFSRVVDTYVSSHPELAALVWGSVRLAFTVLANFTSFFQTFSTLLNGFDSLTPQFKEYQVLFTDSLPLRNSVYDFHSAIIACCTQLVSLTRRTWSQKVLAAITSSFESEISPRVTEIREKAKLVKRQAVLAKAQDDSRRQARLAAELRLREKERKWNSLLLKLSSYDHGSAFNHARGKIHRGTAEWIFSTSEFQDWYESTDSSVLNISGKIGSGKTILAASVVSHLSQKLSPNCSVSYLFVRFDDDNSRLADVILRSLIFQSLTGREVQDDLMDSLEKSASNGFELSSLLSLFGQSISFLEQAFVVVDGLDQCSQPEQHALLRMLSQLLQVWKGHGAVKILISARESMVKGVNRALAPTKHRRIGLADTDADLARYAAEILAEKQDRGELVIGDESIMNQIVDKLQTGGEGMFLWVILTIEDICSCPTDHDIRRTLETLPRKLSDTFNRALTRAVSSQPYPIVDLVQKTFRWVATVRRPVTRWELGEALGVKVLQKSSMKDQIINGTERLPGWCENLVQIEAGDETVHFFHHSIKTHLLDMKLKATELKAFHVDLKAWDHQVGEVCLTYLSFGDFERALTEFSSGNNSLHVRQIAMSNVGRSIPEAVMNQATLESLPDTGRYQAARFLRRFSKPTKSGQSLLVPNGAAGSASEDFSTFFAEYPFLVYATEHWFHHSSYFFQGTTKTWNLWEDRVTKSILENEESWANFGQQPPSFETFGSTDSTSSLADQGSLAVAVSNDAERIMLHKAIIFADFIAHEALLNLVLTTVVNREYELSPAILEQLLPTRKVFQFPREREGYLRDENAHDGLASLVTEFVAWGGTKWPEPSSIWMSTCNDACAEKPLHKEMLRIPLMVGYSRFDEPELQLFAKIATLKLAKETSDDIEAWVNSNQPCIHEFETHDQTDVIDVILAVGGLSAFDFARWVLDLHENCVGGQKYKSDDWRRKSRAAIRDRKSIAVEFYLKESASALAENKEYGSIDFALSREIVTSWWLPPDARSQAIAIAITGIAEEETPRAYEESKYSIISGNWDISVALSKHGLRLANSVPHAGEGRSWFRVIDDVLCCVFESKNSRCTLVTVEDKTKPSLELCTRHTVEAEHAWDKEYPPEPVNDTRVFESFHKVVRSAITSVTLSRAEMDLERYKQQHTNRMTT